MSIEFLLTTLIVVIAPGTGVVYTLATGLSGGTKASIAAAFGCTLGILPSILACLFGITALLHTSALAFTPSGMRLGVSTSPGHVALSVGAIFISVFGMP